MKYLLLGLLVTTSAFAAEKHPLFIKSVETDNGIQSCFLFTDKVVKSTSAAGYRWTEEKKLMGESGFSAKLREAQKLASRYSQEPTAVESPSPMIMGYSTYSFYNLETSSFDKIESFINLASGKSYAKKLDCSKSFNIPDFENCLKVRKVTELLDTLCK